MAIVRAPLKSDPEGKCSRWRVILYNPTTKKQDWFTIEGRRADAAAFERQQREKMAKGTYVARAERKTFAELATLFLREREARNRRGGTLAGYRGVLDRYLLPHFGPWEVGKIRRADVIKRLDELRAQGATAQTVNRIIRTAKAVLFFAQECELVDRNVTQRLRPYERADGERRAKRSSFTEEEIRAILTAARPHERALIGLLVFTGLRPGEMYALDWAQVDLDAGCLQVVRSWDGKQFQKPKTEAGQRVVPLSSWLIDELRTHRERTPGTGLVFGTRSGKPLSASNLRRDVWLPLKKRAGVRDLDLYSLRHSFASFARTAGEASFNVSRALGHSRSTLVDQVYAHALPSGLAGVAEAVTQRALGVKPKLRAIDGGKRDVREALEGEPAQADAKAVTG